jgi:acetyl esterase/lipase
LDGIEQWDISVDAAVIYAAVRSMAADNRRPTTGGSSIDGRKTVADQLPDYADVRAAGRLARILARGLAAAVLRSDHEPVLVHHGTRDDTCPIRWSEATVKALKAAGNDVTFVKYRGEGHTFERQWQRSIERTVAYFDKHLD